MSAAVRVRFAPSPTGYLHVGGARTALFNWLYARQTGGVFVLRIEDTDRERSSDEMTRAILEGMTWLGLGWDEGPFHQAEGVDRHRADAHRLLAEGKAYRCFCASEELQARREAAETTSAEAYRYDRRCLGIQREEAESRAGEPHVVRFRVPEGSTGWDDVVHGDTRFRNEDIEDLVLLRTDGTPTYNLAVVSDDIEMRITHVLRGDDHLANTPKQILLYEALGAEVPTFGHLPMILGSDGKRLSKRHGATAVGEYERMGILPGALDNFLALLGWNPGDEQEVMTLDELTERFSVERILRKSSVFDHEKLLWMNGQHLMAMPAAALAPTVADGLVAAGLLAREEVERRGDWLLLLTEVLQPRSRVLGDFTEQARLYLSEGVAYDADAVAKQWAKEPLVVSERLAAVAEALGGVGKWERSALEEALRALPERLGVGFGKVVHPLRVALTGGSASPGIDAVLALLGRAETLRRIDDARRELARLAGERGD